MKKSIKIAFIIDMQHDFIADDGTLQVEGAKSALKNIIQRLKTIDYDGICFTTDQHPFDHCSFIENGGKWPMHCVEYTKGASIPMELIEAAYKNKAVQCVKVICKGTKKDKDEYSFFKNIMATYDWSVFKDVMRDVFFERYKDGQYFEFLRDRVIDIMGVAGDVCVLDTVKDFVDEKYKDNIVIINDCIASLDGGTALKEYCTENQIKTE